MKKKLVLNNFSCDGLCLSTQAYIEDDFVTLTEERKVYQGDKSEIGYEIITISKEELKKIIDLMD